MAYRFQGYRSDGSRCCASNNSRNFCEHCRGNVREGQVVDPSQREEEIPPAPSFIAALREKPQSRLFQTVPPPEDDGPIVAASDEEPEYVPASPSLFEALRGGAK
jgi:hypothetical protein